MTEPDQDPLGDPPMAKLLRRFGAQITAGGSAASLSPRRRAALQAALDEVDLELRRDVRRDPRKLWLLIGAAAAVLVIGVVTILCSAGVPVPQLTAVVARAEPMRGAPPTSAFTVGVTPGEPGFVRIDAFTVDGRRHPLPLRDGQPMARIDARMRFGEFELPDAWRLLVVFAPSRQLLVAAASQTPEQLAGSNAAERLRALTDVAQGIRRAGLVAVELTMP